MAAREKAAADKLFKVTAERDWFEHGNAQLQGIIIAAFGILNGPTGEDLLAGIRRVTEAHERLTRLSTDLLSALDAVHRDPQYQSIFVLNYARGGRYSGPTYAKELQALSDALLAPPEEAKTEQSANRSNQ